jgi:hypothetical protein
VRHRLRIADSMSLLRRRNGKATASNREVPLMIIMQQGRLSVLRGSAAVATGVLGDTGRRTDLNADW